MTRNLVGIEDWISMEEKQTIEVMPISAHKGKDLLIWPLNCHGVYIAKSSFKILKQDKLVMNGGIASSSHIVEE